MSTVPLPPPHTPPLLGEDAFAALLRAHPAWQRRADGLAVGRVFHFDDFVAAFAFMSKVALLAERHSHHPDWRNVYNRVDVWLQTHDAGGVTVRDAELVAAIDAAVSG